MWHNPFDYFFKIIDMYGYLWDELRKEIRDNTGKFPPPQP